MSADLFKQEGRSLLSTFTPVDIPEPGVWDGYFRGTGMSLLRNAVKVARSVDMLRAVGPIAQDALGFGVERGGTTVQDMFFREHDERYNSAVDLLTPRPGEVGAAAEITGSLLTLLPMVVASPVFAVGSSILMTGEDLVRDGVRADSAAVAGTMMGAGLATGIWMPILGQNLWQRMVIGGALANTAQGAATRGAIGTYLESGDATAAEKKAAEGFRALDPAELTTDVLLGLAFGRFVHLNPRAREEGAEAWKRIADWAQALKPSDKAAIAVLREAQHLNKDSFPGTPVGAEDVNAHVERLRRAIDQAERGQPIAVDDLPAPRAEPDTQRNAEAEARMAEMLVEAEAIREAEGLPPAPLPDLPPARPVLERTPEGAPRLTTDRVVLDEPRVFHVEQDVTYYESTVRSPEGGPLGVVALGWRGDEVVELLNIQAIEKNQGMGSAVLSGILRHNAPDTEVWIRLIQPESRGFWEKMGATLFETEEGTDGTLTKAQFDTARANRGTAPATGRAGPADAGQGQTAAPAPAPAPAAPAANDGGVKLGQPVRIALEGKEEPKTIVYERLPDGRLKRTITYDDGETFVEILHTDKNGDEVWVSKEGYNKGEYYPMQFSEAGAQAKALESALESGYSPPAPEGGAAATSAGAGRAAQTEAAPAPAPRTRIEVPADLAAADPETQARAIGQSIEDRLLELGVDAAEARANGAIWEAFFRTLAQKYGVNPGETLASYGIDIRRLDTIADLPGALAQATTPSQSWYYSALGQAIEKANMNAAPAKEWKDMLKGLIQKGVKPDEIKWSGIEEWLAMKESAAKPAPMTEIPREIPAETPLYHGTASKIDQLQGITYLTDNADEAAVFARGDIPGTRRAEGGGKPTVLEATSQGRLVIKNIDKAVQNEIMEGGDLDALVREAVGTAKRQEYDAVAFMHPGSASQDYFVAIVPTRPEELLVRPMTGPQKITKEEVLDFLKATPYTQPERGVIHFGNGQTMIGLMATANRSTFLHESGRLFLQITRDVVQNPEIPAQARADWDRLSAWLGIKPDTATIPVEAHEKFARGFEAYLREGKAPNQGLQDVFRRFRDWLLDIYHSLADLRVELSDDVRGIMARMLDSQARDPITAKGPVEPAPRASPPPPPGDGGEATPRPEAPPTPEGARASGALEGPDPWDVEGSIPAQGPDVPFEPVGLDNPDMRTMLLIMADEEAGWLEIGGRLDRSRLADPEKLGTPAFTKWVPKADWWPQREGKLNEAQTREAVRRALAGEKLTKKQQAAIDYMMDVANQRLHAEKVLGSDEFGAIARDLVDEGMDPTTQDITEVAMIARAAEIDEARVERAAMIHEGNHDAFLEEIRTILDEAAEREAGAPPAEPAGRPGQEGAGAQGREGGEGRPDPVAAAAQRFVDQNPTRTIQVVDDAGNTRTMTAAEYLQEARDQAAAAREDVGLFQAAAECLLGGGR